MFDIERIRNRKLQILQNLALYMCVCQLSVGMTGHIDASSVCSDPVGISSICTLSNKFTSMT